MSEIQTRLESTAEVNKTVSFGRLSSELARFNFGNKGKIGSNDRMNIDIEKLKTFEQKIERQISKAELSNGGSKPQLIEFNPWMIFK